MGTLKIWNATCNQWEIIELGASIPPDCHDFIQSETSSYVTVCTNTDAKVNGESLIAAYAAAKLLTPNGAALSATNRACVILPPAKYDLDHGTENACVPLILDTEFVDIIGLTTDRSLQHIYGTPPATNSGVIIQTANDVHISNLTVEILTEVVEANFDNTDSAAYFPSTNLSNTVIDNCEFKGGDANDGPSPVLFSNRIVIEYSGIFTNCTGGTYLFGGSGTASGIFNNCTGGSYSFGGSGIASGIFTNCTGGQGAFGAEGTASGTFNNCTGGSYSFGSNNGTASGIFTNCTGGQGAFGGIGIASGTFSFCKGDSDSFGGSGISSGTFSFCKGSTDSYNNQTPTASVATVVLVAGGTGYTADDELTVVGGTGTAATIKVLTVNAGVIETAEILTVGSYTVEPANAVAVTGNGNDDATFNLTWNEGHIYGCVDDTGFIAELNWDD